jgi:hypothetical protein
VRLTGDELPVTLPTLYRGVRLDIRDAVDVDEVAVGIGMWASTRATKSSASTVSTGSLSWTPRMSALGDRADIGFSIQLRYHP